MERFCFKIYICGEIDFSITSQIISSYCQVLIIENVDPILLNMSLQSVDSDQLAEFALFII